MSCLFLEYPKCTTCRKAKKWLEENNIDFIDRDIKLENPTKEELKLWLDRSGLEIKKFFNTNGALYREKGMKDKIKELSEDELLNILASDGMMVKRPLIICDSKVLVGFKEAEWESNLK
ncbi:arsenate reductase [Clostridium moniliforme]|uniref:Arsenate reductase n=1 Tax=Clostridium moniliforme TaxID=39489 RepID=A0ABS4F1P9_9CLOT|nr:arsenate reductase family protein [Clostridium moniliforme]MBP1890012.1 arsenate reductase [Clostridium moniliforme]